MTEHNVFTKKHTEEVTQAKQTLLDELNLPPHATTFIRENKRILWAVFLFVIFSICGRSYYIHYTTSILNNSSSALAESLLLDDTGLRMQAMQAVTVDHVGTGAANWATIEMAKQSIEDKQYSEAITGLQALLSTLKNEAPELVLCKLLLAHAYEENMQNEPALALYKDVREIHEYMVVGNINVARVFEKMGQNKEAIDAYEKASSSPGLSQPEKDWLKDRIRHLSLT